MESDNHSITCDAIRRSAKLRKELISTPEWEHCPHVWAREWDAECSVLLSTWIRTFEKAEEIPDTLFIAHEAALTATNEAGDRILLRRSESGVLGFDEEVIADLIRGPGEPLRRLSLWAMKRNGWTTEAREGVEGNSPTGQTSDS